MMGETFENLSTVKVLLNEAATLCRKEQKKLLLYFISMALAELASEMAVDENGAQANTVRH